LERPARALRQLVKPPERKPVPPSRLVWRVTGNRDRKVFLESGRRSAREMRAAIGVELIGTDIDGKAIAWARENIPYARFLCNEGLPPLDLPDASVDLVLNHSVFTHLDELHQDAWLSELRRVTKPGGTVLLSVHGMHPFESTLPHWRTFDWFDDGIEREWAEKGFVFVDEGTWRGTFPDFYRTTYHAPWYVFRRWSHLFDIKAYLVRASLDFQDFVLMQRPAVDPEA